MRGARMKIVDNEPRDDERSVSSMRVDDDNDLYDEEEVDRRRVVSECGRQQRFQEQRQVETTN